jgi:sec-independent protein translocase protein TatA
MVGAAGPFGLGPLELVVILLVLVMIFGATRLADLGGSLGKGIREFKRNVKDDEEEAAAAAPPVPVATATAAPPVVVPPTNGAEASNGSETVAAVKCPNCGSLNALGSKHCNQCGSAITAPVS